MVLKYILKKIYNRIYLKFLATKRIFPNLYHIGKEISKDVKTILFFFPNSTFMNFGDHLFFEPVCRLLSANGFKVSIIPLKQMNYYFEKLGFPIANGNGLNNYDLIISRPDFISELKSEKNVILIDIAYAGITQPLINDVCSKFIQYFNLTHATQAKPQYITQGINCFEKFHLNREKKYIIYNNYLKSGSFRVTKDKYENLESFLTNFKKSNPELEIIHTGSNNDKLNDKKNYSFIDIDLRGKTTVMDLFDLSALPNLAYYIGFDAFVMHLFFILGKKAFVLSRGRWSQKERFFLENFIDPPFAVENLEAIKEYIR